MARSLAQRLGFRFLDTGAMYRAVAYAAMREGIDWSDSDTLAELAASLSIDLDGSRVQLSGQDVTEDVRKMEVTAVIHHVADNPRIRSHLVGLQQRLAASNNVVTEGRDQGTVAFPDAQCKIFLFASPEERARRRQKDLEIRGEHLEFSEVLSRQNKRDQRDTERPVGGLSAAEGAFEFCTDGLTVDEVVEQLVDLVRSTQQS